MVIIIIMNNIIITCAAKAIAAINREAPGRPPQDSGGTTCLTL